jgi:Glyoxalase-like domain
MSLAFDHVFCVVDDLDDAAMQISAAGWSLDAGSAHAGQGTCNRRMAWAEHYLELLHVRDHDEAARNRLRLDRRADWRATGASPIGIGLRGSIPLESREEFWLYDKLGVRIWVNHDNELAPQRPLVIVLELTTEQLEQRNARSAAARATAQPPLRAIRQLQITGPARAWLPPHGGPPITHALGIFHLHINAGPGPTRSITDTLAITGVAPTHQRKATTLT